MKIDQLYTPFKLRSGVTLKSHLVAAPMDIKKASNGALKPEGIQFYGDIAAQVSMVIIGSAYVSLSGNTAFGSVSVASDRVIPELKKVADAIHQNHSKAILQIVHAGRMTNRMITNGQDVIAPSVVQGKHGIVDLPKAMTLDDISQVINEFLMATRRAIAAGFDGIEIHGANTFLIQQFMSPLSNKRTDQWGGSLLKRVQFPVLLTQRILQLRDQLKRSFIIGYRISPEEREIGGLCFEDNLFLIEILNKLGIDYLSLSLGHYGQCATSSTRLASYSVTSVVKQLVGDLPVMTAGQIRTLRDITMSTGDLLGVASPFLGDTSWMPS